MCICCEWLFIDRPNQRPVMYIYFFSWGSGNRMLSLPSCYHHTGCDTKMVGQLNHPVFFQG